MRRFLTHVRHNLIAYVALFVALGGTTYAATALPAGSVGTRQLRNGAVTPPKLNHRLIGGYVRAWAVTNGACQLVASSGGARVVSGTPCAGSSQLLTIRWRGKFPRRQACMAFGVPTDLGSGISQPAIETDYVGRGQVSVGWANPAFGGPGQGVAVALIC
jgi:hypothetical protein